MAINHRKLSLSCESFCDPILNPKGSCPIPCASWCPSVCTSLFPPHLIIPQPYPPPAANAAASGGHSVNKLHLFLIIFLSTLVAACFAFCCFTYYKFYKSRQILRRRSLLQHQLQEEGTNDEFLDANHGPVLDHPIWYIRTVGLQPNVINAITVCKYKRGDGLVEGTECSVCLNEFQDDDILRLLPKCNHAFHIPCIDTWLRSHTNCPLCRAGIVSNTGAASFPTPAPPEQSVDNPVAVEEASVVIQESSGELTRERDDPGFELSTGTEEEKENETRVENGGNGPETLKDEAVDEVQPLRRSVSLDSVSASMIGAAIANARLRESAVDCSSSAAQLEKGGELNASIVPKKVDVNQSLARLVGGSSLGRSLTNGPNSVKRSLSCSGKLFLSRYTRRRNSLLPS